MSNIIRSEYGMVLEISGETYDIAQFETDIAVNQIPTARCVLATGRNAGSGTTAAKIHSSIGDLEPFAICKVYLCASGQWSDVADWPSDPTLVFEGKLVGIGYQKLSGKVALVAHMQHWLADLDYSSVFSEQSHPRNSADYVFGAIVGAAAPSGGLGVGKPYGLSQSAEGEVINATNVNKDLWGSSLKPLFCALASARHVRLDGRLKECLGLGEGTNDQSLAALSRIEGDSGLNGACDKPLSAYTPKLALNLAQGLAGAPLSIGDSIATAIRKESIASYAQSTLWGKLVNVMAPSFCFSVIPLIDKAIVVPDVAGLRHLYCKSIRACDYTAISLNGPRTRPLRGVAVLGGNEMGTGAGFGGNVASQVAVGGCFSPNPAPTDGLVLFMNGPTWLQGLAASGHDPGKTTGLRGRVARSSATTPFAERDAALLGNRDGKNRYERLVSTTELYDYYAHAAYVQASLSGRTGMVTGKLRFDIAPGSVVKIEGTAERFLSDADQLGQNMIGSVVRTSIGINAESGRAGTSFYFKDLRTEAENASDRTSVNGHPLYITYFSGAPLIDSLQFASEGNGCE